MKGNPLNKNTTIDGVPVGEEGGDGTTIVTPNIDAIGEVTVITDGYKADERRQSSGSVRIVTKAGSNELRGWVGTTPAETSWNARRLFPHRSRARRSPIRGEHLGTASAGRW